MSSLQLQKLLDRIKNHKPRNQENNHQEDVLNKYKQKNIEIAYNKVKIEHDGFDQYGPQSNLYTFFVYYRIGYDYYLDVWHREDWYHGDDDDPYILYSFNNQYKKIQESLFYKDKNYI